MRGMLRLSALPRAAGASRVARVQRTTTTATLLVTVAVSALSGCVTVQRPLAPGPATAPPQRIGPGPDGRNETQVVQAPAREALEMVGPSRPPKKPASPSHRAAPTTPPERSTPSEGRTLPARPEPDGRVPSRPPKDLPDVGGPAKGSSDRPDLCALGREYGGWHADSPEAAICRDTYGR
ncbi:lipoprotein [Streptomyces malachitofuscus]|nr:lipoprotein [Streptomyces malachitofuscus]